MAHKMPKTRKTAPSATNNYIKMAARYGETLFFFFDQNNADTIMAALTAASLAKKDHDAAIPARGSKAAGEGNAHLSVWRKCHLLKSLPEVGEFVEIVPVHNAALVS